MCVCLKDRLVIQQRKLKQNASFTRYIRYRYPRQVYLLVPFHPSAIVLNAAIVCWLLRKRILDLANRGADQMNRMLGYHLLPTTLGSFEDDIQDGLTSSQFDLEANLDQDDQRAGLKDKEEILKIMKKQKVSFDEARLIRQQRLLKKNVSDMGFVTRA